ncbi:MAG: chromate resistance protein [Thermoproteota archaeon]|nr:chromate resistance protein [Thermoproteota archaeon]
MENLRKWVTREKAKLDRIACSWHIKNFVDSEPEFFFVPADSVLDIAKEQNVILLMFQMLNLVIMITNVPSMT